jgi:hypothetical protein
MSIPAILKDYGTCWQDEFPNPVCKSAPRTDPPIIEWSCAETIGGNIIAKLRIPPGTCVRVVGRFDPNKGIRREVCEPFTPVASSCRMRVNWTDEEDFTTIYGSQDPSQAIQSWTAWWYPAGECTQCITTM